MNRKPTQDLDPNDQRLVEQIEEYLTPEPRSPAQRLLFAEALEAKLDTAPASHALWRPAAAAVAAFTVALALWSTTARQPATDAEVGYEDALLMVAWDDNGGVDLDDILPDDYALLADLLGM